MTPAELAAVAEGVRRRIEADEKRMVQAAWITAALTRTETLPELHKLLGKRKEQTPEERAAIMRRWAAAVSAQRKAKNG